MAQSVILSSGAGLARQEDGMAGDLALIDELEDEVSKPCGRIGG